MTFAGAESSNQHKRLSRVWKVTWTWLRLFNVYRFTAALKVYSLFSHSVGFCSHGDRKAVSDQIHNQISKHIKCNKSENIFIADDSITDHAKSINIIIFRFRFLFFLEAKEISELRLTHYYVQCDDYSRHASIISFASDGWMNMKK